jgi:hypothetical protein
MIVVKEKMQENEIERKKDYIVFLRDEEYYRKYGFPIQMGSREVVLKGKEIDIIKNLLKDRISNRD